MRYVKQEAHSLFFCIRLVGNLRALLLKISFGIECNAVCLGKLVFLTVLAGIFGVFFFLE